MRNTTLKKRLLQEINGNHTPDIGVVKEDMSYEERLMNTDPMVGMENISPYDFMIEDRAEYLS